MRSTSSPAAMLVARPGDRARRRGCTRISTSAGPGDDRDEAQIHRLALVGARRRASARRRARRGRRAARAATTSTGTSAATAAAAAAMVSPRVATPSVTEHDARRAVGGDLGERAADRGGEVGAVARRSRRAAAAAARTARARRILGGGLGGEGDGADAIVLRACPSSATASSRGMRCSAPGTRSMERLRSTATRMVRLVLGGADVDSRRDRRRTGARQRT